MNLYSDEYISQTKAYVEQKEMEWNFSNIALTK